MRKLPLNVSCISAHMMAGISAHVKGGIYWKKKRKKNCDNIFILPASAGNPLNSFIFVTVKAACVPVLWLVMSLVKRSMHLKAQQILNLFSGSFSLTFFKGIIMVIQANSVFENMQKHKPIWSAYNWKQAGLLCIPSGFKWSIHERDYGQN